MLAAHVRPHVKEMPPLEGFMTIPIAVDVRFHKWDDILKMPKPNAGNEDRDRVLALRARHGAGRQRESRTKPRRNTRSWRTRKKNTPEDVVFAMPVNNKTKDVLKIARDVLGAKIALGEERQRCRHRAAARGGGGAGFAEIRRARGLVLSRCASRWARRF